MVDTRALRLGVLRGVLSLDYVASELAHDVTVGVELDAPLPEPLPGLAIRGFATAVSAGAFCGASFPANLSDASLRAGDLGQTGPRLEFTLSVRGMDPLGMRVLVDELTWALAYRKILSLRIAGGPTHPSRDAPRIDDRQVLDLMTSPQAYPARGAKPVVEIVREETGIGYGIVVDAADVMDDDAAALVETRVFTWRNAVKRFLSADGDDPVLPPAAVLARSGRNARSFACAYRTFESDPTPATAVLGNVLDRIALDGLALVRAKVVA